MRNRRESPALGSNANYNILGVGDEGLRWLHIPEDAGCRVMKSALLAVNETLDH